MARITNFGREKGSLSDVIKGADVFIGVSAPGTLTGDKKPVYASKLKKQKKGYARLGS
jgi:hypothetical protein